MILAYAGRRAHSIKGDLALVRARLHRLLAALQPSAVVGAAADGADLLLLETVLAMPNGPRVHLVLPTAREVFGEDSVAEEWRDRFETVLVEIAKRGGNIRTLDKEPGEAAYGEANQAMLDTASSHTRDGQRAVALLIAQAGEGLMLEDMVGRARVDGLPTLRIDPDVDLSSRPRCFVATSFGAKPGPLRRNDFDGDQVYDKVLVPALENAQLNYRRADESIDSGVIVEPMLEWLASADLVIGDLGTDTFNVAWESRLKHVLRPDQTLLIGPAGTAAPHDLAALRHVPYHQDASGISDDAAVEAWAELAPHLASAGSGVSKHRAGSPS